jgi:NADPH2:quinone reductase
MEIYGSGGGSIPHTAIFEAFPKVLALVAGGQLRVDTKTVPLADVESIWQRKDLPGCRLVFIP